MMKWIAPAAAGLAALLLGAWTHGAGSGFNFTVNFDSLAANSRFDITAQNSVFTDPAVLSPFNLDAGDVAHELFKIVDASGYPGAHAKALQTLFPYGALGGNLYASPSCPSAPCPVAGYGPQSWWGFGLNNSYNTYNVEWDVLFPTGFDFRYIGGKIAPVIIFGTGGFGTNEVTHLKIWWEASNNTTDCPRRAWPATGSCLTFFKPNYEDFSGTPVPGTGQALTSWEIQNDKWYHWKLQYHRGCPSDAAVLNGDTIDFTGGVHVTTNGFTAVGGTILNFVSTTGVVDGHVASDLTHPSAIPGGATVLSHTSTTVTLSASLVNANCTDVAEHKIWGPTSNSDATQILYLDHVSTSAEANADTSVGYFPGIDVPQWFGGGDVDSAEAAGSATVGTGSFVLYDNIRVWSGTGP